MEFVVVLVLVAGSALGLLVWALMTGSVLESPVGLALAETWVKKMESWQWALLAGRGLVERGCVRRGCRCGVGGESLCAVVAEAVLRDWIHRRLR